MFKYFVMFLIMLVSWRAQAADFELPLMADTSVYLIQGNAGSNSGSYSHYYGSGEEYSWDWTGDHSNICQEPSIAPVSGTVTAIETSCSDGSSCASTNSSCGHGFGNYIIIDYGDGYRIVAHHHAVYVTVGEEVKQGQVIGLVGSTGYSTAAHIHDESMSGPNPGNQSFTTMYHGMDDNGVEFTHEIPNQGEYYTSTNSAMFDDRDSTALTTTNPYSNASNWLGDAEGEIHWWDGYMVDDPTDTGAVSNGYAQSLYIQDYDGAYCDSTKSYGTGVNDGAIVYDALGGARSAYIVQCEQWQAWISEDVPTIGPESWLGNPVTNVYKAGYYNYYQLFQHGYIRVNADGSVTTKSYANGFAPGELADGSWDPQISYRFAEAYELRGAHKKLGMPVSGVEQVNSHYYVQHFPGQKPRSDDDRYLLYGVDQQAIIKISSSQYATLVSSGSTSVSGDVDDTSTDTLDQDSDGYTPNDGDCDDTHFYVHPDHPEWLDGIDNDCDGAIDNDLPSLVGSTYTSQEVSTLVPVAWIDPDSDVQAYVNPFTGQLHGVFAGDDGDLYEVTRNNDTDDDWSVLNLSDHIWVPYVAPSTQPFGFANEVSGMRYVVFTAETGDIWMFSITSNNDIAVVDLSAHIWVPYATTVTDPMGYADPTTGDIHVVFTGNDGQVWHLRVDGTTGGYSSGAVSVSGVGFYPGTNPFPFMDPLIGDHYILYTGTNGRVYLLISSDGDSYSALDVSAQAAVAYSNSTPTGLVDPLTEEFYVYILGDDERLYELHYDLSTWTSRDFSGLTPVPYMEPGTTPSATVNPFTGEHLISVLGDNQRVTLFTSTDSTVTSIDLSGQAAVAYTEPGTAPWVTCDPTTGATYVLFTGDDERIQWMRYGP